MSAFRQDELPGAGIESLPLFSGTAQRVELPVPREPAGGRQAGMFACPICRDTGKVGWGSGARYCWCEAGEGARRWDRAIALRNTLV